MTASKAELTNKIIISVGNEIITNYDLIREKKYISVITVLQIKNLNDRCIGVWHKIGVCEPNIFNKSASHSLLISCMVGNSPDLPALCVFHRGHKNVDIKH